MKGARLAIALATHNPPPALWRRQVASLREQTCTDWVCLLQDDASSPAAWGRLRASVAGDRRFKLARNRRRLGFYRNFEAALKRVPAQAAYVAFCDQDDRWHPAKLERSVAELEASGALLVHSNMRLVGPQGQVLAPRNWVAPFMGRADLESLCLANVVTGAGALFRAALLKDALPFPALPGPLYHDHWLALLALSLGSLAYLAEPQWDYVQHRSNTLGHGAPPPPGAWRACLRALFEGRPGAQQAEAARRLVDQHLHRGAAYAGELQARLGPRLTPAAAAELGRVQAAARSLPALAALCGRGLWRGRDAYRLEARLLAAQWRTRRLPD